MLSTLILSYSLLCPLQEADPHFQSYRIMMIESCILDLESTVFQVKDHVLREKMFSIVQAIKYNLGDGNTYQ